MTGGAERARGASPQGSEATATKRGLRGEEQLHRGRRAESMTEVEGKSARGHPEGFAGGRANGTGNVKAGRHRTETVRHGRKRANGARKRQQVGGWQKNRRPGNTEGKRGGGPRDDSGTGEHGEETR